MDSAEMHRKQDRNPLGDAGQSKWNGDGETFFTAKTCCSGRAEDRIQDRERGRGRKTDERTDGPIPPRWRVKNGMNGQRRLTARLAALSWWRFPECEDYTSWADLRGGRTVTIQHTQISRFHFSTLLNTGYRNHTVKNNLSCVTHFTFLTAPHQCTTAFSKCLFIPSLPPSLPVVDPLPNSAPPYHPSTGDCTSCTPRLRLLSSQTRPRRPPPWQVGLASGHHSHRTAPGRRQGNTDGG